MNSKGFIFLELVVVLMLTAVLSGIAVPKLSRLYRASAADADAGRVLAVFNTAKTEAMRSREKVRVKIDPKAGELTLLLMSETGGDVSDMKAVLADSVIENILMNNTSVSLNSDVMIDIYPMMVKKSAVISLRGSDGDLSDIRLAAGGGRLVVR